jgi:hypothetical protein
MRPIHVKQYHNNIQQQQQQQQLVKNAIVLNTMQAIGDEGFWRYECSKNNNSTANNTNCSDESNLTLMPFSTLYWIAIMESLKRQ